MRAGRRAGSMILL